MNNNYLQIRESEEDIDQRKQEFMLALGKLAAAEVDDSPVEVRLSMVSAAHQLAVRYFSRVEKWVAESAYLRAHEDPTWRVSLVGHCNAVLHSYIKYWDFLGRQSLLLDPKLRDRYYPGDDAYWMMQGMVRLEYPNQWPKLRKLFSERSLPTVGFDDEKRLSIIREGRVKGEPMSKERWIAVIFGTVFIATMLFLNVAIPNPTPTQETTFRVVLALASGAVGAVLPGVLNLTGRWAGFTVRATGALALFFIVYFWNPPASGGQSSVDTVPQTDITE